MVSLSLVGFAEYCSALWRGYKPEMFEAYANPTIAANNH